MAEQKKPLKITETVLRDAHQIDFQASTYQVMELYLAAVEQQQSLQ